MGSTSSSESQSARVDRGSSASPRNTVEETPAKHYTVAVGETRAILEGSQGVKAIATHAVVRTARHPSLSTHVRRNLQQRNSRHRRLERRRWCLLPPWLQPGACWWLPRCLVTIASIFVGPPLLLWKHWWKDLDTVYQEKNLFRDGTPPIDSILQ